MKTLLKTFSLLSVLCSQVSLTLYKVSSPLSRDEKTGNNTENVTAIEGEDVSFRYQQHPLIELTRNSDPASRFWILKLSKNKTIF